METRVRSVLKHKGNSIVTVSPDQNIRSFAYTLYANRIGATPVVDAENKVIGMISERDVIRGIVEYGHSVLALPVESLMTRLVNTCTLDDTIGEVMEMITLHRTRHVPVVKDGRLEGIISIGDVVNQMLEEARFEVNSLQSYITSP